MKKRKEKSETPVFDAEGYQVNLQSLNGEGLPKRESLKFKPLNHGGARVGAGRRPAGRKPLLLRLSPGVIAELRAKAKAERRTLSDVAEERLAIA